MLDGAAAQVAVGIGLEARFVFAAFAGVGLSLDAIHGDGEGFVRFLADGAERHGAGGKALHDFRGGLDVFERHRRAGGLEIEHAAQHQQIAILLVDDLGEFLEGFETRLPHGVLQLAHRGGIQQVALAAHAILIFAADAKLGVGFAERLHGELVLHQRFAREDFDAHAFDARGGAGEIAVDELAIQADGLENLRALVALQRGDAHLREGLQQALVGGLHVALENLVPGVVGREMAVAVEIFERSDGEVGIHGARAIAQQAGQSASPREARPIRRSRRPGCAFFRESDDCAPPKAPAGSGWARARDRRRDRKESEAYNPI